jgi:hypothetical protein
MLDTKIKSCPATNFNYWIYKDFICLGQSSPIDAHAAISTENYRVTSEHDAY